MDTAAEILDFIGPEALAAVEATEIKNYDDYDTPGVQFDVVINRRDLRVVVTLQPTGAYKVLVFDPRVLETLRDEPDVTGDHLQAVIENLAEELS
jgi:hypothetical protein